MRQIHYTSVREGMELIVKSAPPSARFFNIVNKLSPTCILVDYDPPVTRFSLAKLGDELGLPGLGVPPKVEKVEPLHYVPSESAKLAAQCGKRGFVLLGGDKVFMRRDSEEKAWEKKLQSMR